MQVVTSHGQLPGLSPPCKAVTEKRKGFNIDKMRLVCMYGLIELSSIYVQVSQKKCSFSEGIALLQKEHWDTLYDVLQHINKTT